MQNLFASDSGSKFPLVLIHGFLGSSQMWEPQINFLKEHFRVIAPDLPGFGKSNIVDLCDSINLMAKSILNLIEKKKIDKFHLLGH